MRHTGRLWMTRSAGVEDQYAAAMSHDPANDDIYIDANGCPTERRVLGDQTVVVHYDDIPASDVTTVHGLPCTTPLRTVIDIAPEVTVAEFERMVRDCLDRGLFSVEEALARIARPDMASRPGARLLGQCLSR
jgi:hypothetical protein